MAVRIKVALAVVGAMLVWFGLKEQRLRGVAQLAPGDVTCAKLAAEGPGSNAHVVLKEFLLCEFAYVYAEEKGRWTGAYVPAVPLNGPYHDRVAELIEEGTPSEQLPMPDDISVLVYLPAARSERDVAQAAQAESLQGMVINEIESLESGAKDMLRQSYPAVDFSRCWIVQVGRRPAGAGKLFGLFGGGGACFVALGLWWLFSRMKDDGTVSRRFEPERATLGGLPDLDRGPGEVPPGEGTGPRAAPGPCAVPAAGTPRERIARR
jgi:hypothetical protein